MAIFNNKVVNLEIVGPVIDVIVHLPLPIELKLKSEEKVPPTKKIIGLIDTGATTSCINKELAEELNLISRETATICTPSGIFSEQYFYDIGFQFPAFTKSSIVQVKVLGADLKEQPYNALIGRDVLSLCTFIYNGWDNSYQLYI